jgi:hypothetical protein
MKKTAVKSGRKRRPLSRGPLPNVDPQASESKRVQQLSALLTPAVADIDGSGPKADAVLRFLLLVAWHESGKLLQRSQVGGPALSLFQIEGGSAKTAYTSNYMTPARLDLLSSYVNVSESDLEDSFQDLTASPSYPRNSIVAAAMLGSDAFGCYVARILLKTRTAALPDPDPTFQAETDYWFKQWHGNQGDPNVFKPKFLADCQSVSPYLPKKAKHRSTTTGTPKPEDTVVNACATAFAVTANQEACNKFVNAVIKICQPGSAFPASYLADDIVGALGSSPWKKLTQGDAAGAVARAAAGDLVVAGLNGTELSDVSGHVVVIHGKARADGVPFGSWGTDSDSIQAADGAWISACFKKALLSKMHYGYVPL